MYVLMQTPSLNRARPYKGTEINNLKADYENPKGNNSNTLTLVHRFTYFQSRNILLWNVIELFNLKINTFFLLQSINYFAWFAHYNPYATFILLIFKLNLLQIFRRTGFWARAAEHYGKLGTHRAIDYRMCQFCSPSPSSPTVVVHTNSAYRPVIFTYPSFISSSLFISLLTFMKSSFISRVIYS